MFGVYASCVSIKAERHATVANMYPLKYIYIYIYKNYNLSFFYRRSYRHRDIEQCYRTSHLFLISCSPTGNASGRGRTSSRFPPSRLSLPRPVRSVPSQSSPDPRTPPVRSSWNWDGPVSPPQSMSTGGGTACACTTPGPRQKSRLTRTGIPGESTN